MHLLEFNSKEYAAGLWWQTSEASSPRALKKEANLLSKTFKEEQDLSYNCFVSQINPSGVLIGLGDCDSFLKNGQIVKKIVPLALAVINASEHQTFLHKYQFDDGCWVCAVLKGVIHPDGDFFGTNEDAQEIFETLLEDVFTSSDQVVEFDDIESKAKLEALLDGDKSTNFIKPIQTQISKKKVIAVLGVITVLIAGFMVYQSMVERKKAKIQKAKMLAVQQQLLAEQQTSESNFLSTDDLFPKEWLPEPTANIFITSCKNALADRDFVENGWQIKEWGCASGTVKIAWEKLDGSSFQVLPKGAEFNIESPQDCVTIDGYVVQSPGRSDVPLWSMEQASAKLHDMAQTFEVKINCDYFLKPEKKVVPDRNDPTKNQTFTASFRKIEFVLTGFEVFPSKSFVDGINSVPGMVIEKIFYGDNWLLKGTVYVAI